MADGTDSYQRACDALRSAAAMWERRALECEHIALHGGEVIIGIDPALRTQIAASGEAIGPVAAQLRECAKEVHAYLDWTPTREAEQLA